MKSVFRHSGIRRTGSYRRYVRYAGAGMVVLTWAAAARDHEQTTEQLVKGLAAVTADNHASDVPLSVTCVALASPDGVAAGVAAALGAPPVAGSGPRKVVYLDFDGEIGLSLLSTSLSSLDSDQMITVPTFEQSLQNIANEPDNVGTAWAIPAVDIPAVAAAWQAEIVAQVAAEYAPFHVLVTDDLATAQLENGGNFERLYVGGSRSMFDNPGTTITAFTLGVSELDLGSDLNNIAFILVEHFDEFLSDTTIAGELMGVVASHEAGHEHGVEHIENVKARMYFRTTMSGPEIVETWRAGKVQNSNIKYQDTHLALAQRLDLSGVPIPVDPTPDDLGDNYFDASIVGDPTASGSVTVNGDLELLGDVDVVTFTAGRATSLTFMVKPAAGVDVVLGVIDVDGNVLALQDAGLDGVDELANLVAVAGQTYFVYVNGKNGLSRGTYQLVMCMYDLDGNGVVGTGDFGLFAACWQSTLPECAQVDFDGDATVGAGDFGCFAGNWLLPCDQVSACGAVPGTSTTEEAATVDIRVLALPTPSGLELAVTLPKSMSRVEPDSPFVIEVWAAPASKEEKLACVFVDAAFDPEAIRVSGEPSIGAAIPWFHEAGFDTELGQLRNLGGCVSLDDGDYGNERPRWVLVARLFAVAGNTVGRTTVSLSPSIERGLGVSAIPRGTIRPVDIHFESLELAIAHAGDADVDGDVDLSDFLAFERCRNGPGSPHAAGCDAADFDGDGDVDLSDFVFFQIAFTGAR